MRTKKVAVKGWLNLYVFKIQDDLTPKIIVHRKGRKVLIF
jgi:hypothetical protein